MSGLMFKVDRLADGDRNVVRLKSPRPAVSPALNLMMLQPRGGLLVFQGAWTFLPGLAI
jgi:hypothetical protein